MSTLRIHTVSTNKNWNLHPEQAGTRYGSVDTYVQPRGQTGGTGHHEGRAGAGSPKHCESSWVHQRYPTSDALFRSPNLMLSSSMSAEIFKVRGRLHNYPRDFPEQIDGKCVLAICWLDTPSWLVLSDGVGSNGIHIGSGLCNFHPATSGNAAMI